jgi:hypothetical protein
MSCVERALWTGERLDDMVDRIEKRFDQVDARFEHFERRMDALDAGMRQLRVEMHRGFESIRRDMFHGLVAMVAAFTALFGVLVVHTA